MNAEYTGRKIAELRKGKNLTQKELANSLHVTDKAVSKWERGVNFPDLGLMEELAKALDSTPSVLLGLEEASKEEIVNSFAEISNQQSEEAAKDIQKVGWLNLFAGIFLVAGMYFINRTMQARGEVFESQVVQWFLYSLISVVIVGGVYTLYKYRAIKKFAGTDILLSLAVVLDVYAFLVIQLLTGRNPSYVVSALIVAIGAVCVQLLFYRVMAPHWMKLLPLLLFLCWLFWGIYIGAGAGNLIVYCILPALCGFIVWFICRRLDDKKEKLLSCLKPFAIVFAVVLTFISGVALYALMFGVKTPSVKIEIKEVISQPVSIYVEYHDETIVLYENSLMESTLQQFPDYNAKSEGTVYLTIGEETYEILSYLDYADRPIVEITGDEELLEVIVYTNLFQTSKNRLSQSTTINLTK